MSQPTDRFPYVRNPRVVAYSSREGYSVIRSAGWQTVRFTSEEAVLVRTIVENCAAAKTWEELEELVISIAPSQAGAARPLLRRLISSGVIIEQRPSVGVRDGQESVPVKRLVVGVCGSIAAVNAPAMLYRLRRFLCEEMEIVITAAAQKFVTPYGLESLTGSRVWTNLYEMRDDVRSPHVYLASRADLVLVFPCTAQMVSKFARAECDDLLSLVVTATKAPVVLVPVMNEGLWMAPGVRQNVDTVRERGMIVVEPGLGLEVGEQLRGQKGQTGGQGVFEHNIVQVLDSILEFVRETRGGSI